MNENTSSPPSTAKSTTQPAARPIDPRVLTKTLAAVRADSQRQPETYLRDTTVPHGGE
jgi:hypothetical protein